jgi:hypothetical protein
MYQEPTVAGTLGWTIGQALWLSGEIAFKWIPGTLIALTGYHNPALGDPLPLQSITSPVTITDVATYVASVAPPSIYSDLYHQWGLFTALSMVVCLLFAAILIYATVRIQQIRHLEHLKYTTAAQTVTTRDVPKTTLRWRRIVEQISSESEQDWRLAILEADIMLNELLDMLGYKGETMGDKMKQVDRGDFQTIDIAWEAHRVRNRIAHEGAAHIMNSREARRIIGLYERVFKEFKLIE